MTAVLSALLSHWTAVVTALQQDPKNEFWHSLQSLGHTRRKEHGENNSLVSALASSNLTCREPFFFISNTCISSKPSSAQFSNVLPLYDA